MHREIQSIEIISEFFLEPIQNKVGTLFAYAADNRLLCDKVKIVFTDGSIIETFLHERKCWTQFYHCLGKYQFTGVITENGSESKCDKCDNVIIGPIYIDREGLMGKARNEQKNKQ